MAKELTELERKFADELLSRAKSAQNEIENWTQNQLDRLSQAIAWYSGNEKTFTRLAQQGVDESGIGDREGRPAKRFKIHMVLRDVLRTPSTGIIETDEKKGLVKYAKPVGVIASLIPMTNPAMTPPVTGVSSANARNAVIFRTPGQLKQLLKWWRQCVTLARLPVLLGIYFNQLGIPQFL